MKRSHWTQKHTMGCVVKSGLPYILRLMETTVIVSAMTDDQNVIAAAVLHDVVEDAGRDVEGGAMWERFNPKSVTEQTWDDRSMIA